MARYLKRGKPDDERDQDDTRVRQMGTVGAVNGPKSRAQISVNPSARKFEPTTFVLNIRVDRDRANFYRTPANPV
jgi:hypothetical protein